MTPTPITITDAASGSSASVLPEAGFNCYSWRPGLELATGRSAPEMLWAEEGYESGDKKPSRSGIPLLFPFPGRIRGGSFTFECKEHQLDLPDGLGNAIHGSAMRHAWRVIDQAEDSVTAEFQPSVDAPEALSQWTGDYTLRATYRVSGGRLEFEFEAKNSGDSPLPFGFATHAYFRLPLAAAAEGIEETIVQAGVDAEWATESLVPSGETLPLGSLGESLPKGGALDGREFDTPYRLANGATETVVSDPRSGVKLSQRFDDSMQCCVIFTPGNREAICLEPYTCVPNPFELQAAGIDTGLRVLQPGEAYRTAITLEASVDR